MSRRNSRQKTATPTVNTSTNGHGPHNGIPLTPMTQFGNDPILLNQLTEALNGLTNNLSSLSRGASRGLDDPRRSIEDECGYPPLDASVPVDLYRQLFDRNSIANRAVQMMPKECWQKSPEV